MALNIFENQLKTRATWLDTTDPLAVIFKKGKFPSFVPNTHSSSPPSHNLQIKNGDDLWRNAPYTAKTLIFLKMHSFGY